MNEVALEFKKFLKMRKGEYEAIAESEQIKDSCSIDEFEDIQKNFFNSHDIIIYPMIDEFDGTALAKSVLYITK